MLDYTEPETYKRAPGIIHFVLIGLCAVIIFLGVLIYFF
ncbi:MAG: hypothetical protein JWQ38_1792 [Flavipsychrobacter sp.]|nr:hypothetical protein [Flavipsychrobacter sp.]